MTLGQTIWGSLLITFFMWAVPLLPLLVVLFVLWINRLQACLAAGDTCHVKRFGRLILAALFLTALVGLGLLFLPFDTVSNLARSFSPDGQITSLNADLYTRFSQGLGLLAAACLVIALMLLTRRQKFYAALHRFLLWLAKQAALWTADAKDFFTRLRRGQPTRFEWIGLLALTLLAAGLHWVYLFKPFLHDEAYTYVGFASRSLRAVVTDYSLPNNHVLHTILVFFSTQLLGVEPWAVRLTSYISGLFCIPAAYFLARRLYNRPAAWLAAALVATVTDLAYKSADARGYMLMTLFTLVLFWLGAAVRSQSNRFAWLLIAVLSALGFYDVPTMLYPFGTLMLWLLLGALPPNPLDWRRIRWPLVRGVLLTGVGTVLLTLLFYATILIGSGPSALFGNQFVLPMDWADFTAIVPVHFGEVWAAWSAGIPLAAWIFAIGLTTCILFYAKIAGQRLPLPLVVLGGITLAVTVQRANPWARLWTFLLPLVLIWVAAGWTWLFTLLTRLHPRAVKTVTAVLVLLVMAAGIWNSLDFYNQGGSQPGTVELMVSDLKDSLKNGDVVLSVSVYEPPMWYYFRRHNIPWTYFEIPPDGRAGRYIVITYSLEKETVVSILQAKKIPSDAYDLSRVETLESNGSVQVVAVPGTP